MSILRTTALAGLATLAACATSAPPQGVGFGTSGGIAQMAAVAPLPSVPAASFGATAYDDGFMYGQLTRTSQGGTDMATLDRIRYHRIFEIRSAEAGAAMFAGRVTEITGCRVTGVSSRASNHVLSSMTAILDCF